MWNNSTRRQVLKGIAAAVGTAAVGPEIVSAEQVDERFLVNTANVDVSKMRRRGNITIIHDMDDTIGHVVCRANEKAIKSLGDDVSYAPDLRIQHSLPQENGGPLAADLDTEEAADAPLLYDLQWDKDEQNILQVHGEGHTGEGARLGVIDSGVLGASQQFDVSHSDLPNIDKERSTAFVPPPRFGGDNFGAGPLAVDHGTHVAGIAAASGPVVTGMAPDAEIVDIRVFSGLTATFGDIIKAIEYGSKEDGGNCDVLNLSLGSGPLLPIPPGEEITDDDDPDGDGPIFPVPAPDLAVLVYMLNQAGQFAIENRTLPIAAAGNDGVDLNHVFEDIAYSGDIHLTSEIVVSFDGSAVSLPNEAEGFMSVSAAGPIGFGWPGDEGSVVPGLPIEEEIDPELETTEPAFFTNYGRKAVDVSAAGGNADIDPIEQEAEVNWFYDLVFNTAFSIPNGNVPADTQLGENYDPSYGWKAGTSMATPTTAGLALLLAAKDPSATAEDIRNRIEETADQVPVGLFTDSPEEGDDGETTAPAQGISIDEVLDSGKNVAEDGLYHGDAASNPDSVDLTDPKYNSENFRGEGHINASAAVDGFGD